MHPFSSPIKSLRRSFFVFFFILSLGFPVRMAAGQVERAIRQQPFHQYGFNVEGFSPEQEKIIEATLAAFEQALGGHGRLAKIMRTYHPGENWTITYVPDWAGADSSMKLGPTVFNMDLALASNFSAYSARDEMTHAQIVIGHEISHLLIRAVRNRTGVHWSKVYEQRVTRDWASIQDPKAPEEEAVTQLSLKVLNAGYYFSVNQDIPETDPEVFAEIDAWAVEFLSTLQRME